MRRILLVCFAIVSFICVALAQDENKYRRSALYSVLVRHPDKEFGKDIDTVFRSIPIPDKFDNHNLKVRSLDVVSINKDLSKEENTLATIEKFLSVNAIPRRLVAKWFNRKEGRIGDGTFDTKLIAERGLYGASFEDVLTAKHSVRGKSLLMDAGENLIANTYVIFNDIRYLDKEEIAGASAAGIAIAGAIASQFTGGLASLAIDATTRGVTRLASSIAGFRVTVTSYLYRLEWDEEVAYTFYDKYYMTEPDDVKKKAFSSEKDLFTVKYVGSFKSVSGQTTLKGTTTKNDMIRKVCERALDENIANLQHQFEEFRVKTPLYSVEPLSAKIGLKEDVSKDRKYEVLEIVENSEGVLEYKRVGVIQPRPDHIWDNRYLADFEDENVGSTIKETEFETISGSGFMPGMLIREL